MNRNKYKKIISGLLLILLISVFNINVFQSILYAVGNASIDISSSVKALALNYEEINKLQYQNDIEQYSFTPDQDGDYVICYDVSDMDLNRIVYTLTDQSGNTVLSKTPDYLDTVCTLKANVTYYIKVFTKSGEKSDYQYPYYILIKKIDNINKDEVVSGELKKEGQSYGSHYCDYFSFTPDESGIYSVRNYSDISNRPLVWDYKGQRIDDYFQYKDNANTINCLAGKTYYICASTYIINQTHYSFKISLQSKQPDIKSINLNTEVTGKLNSKDDVVSYSFTPSQDGYYVTSFCIAEEDLNKITYNVYDKAGNSLTSINSSYLKDIYELKSNQEYTIKVYTVNDKTSTYQNPYYIFIKNLAPIPISTDMTGKFTSINNGTQLYDDVFYFAPQTDGIYAIRNSGKEGTYEIVWDEQGNRMDKAPDNTTIDLIQFKAGKKYFIAASTSNVTNNQYSFRIDLQTQGIKSFTLKGAAYGNGVYVTVGENGTIKTSIDSIIWTSQNSGTNNFLLGVIWGNNEFLAYGLGGTILKSSDGINWSINAVDCYNLWDAVWTGNKYVIVGLEGIMTSTDGVTWSKKSVTSPNMAAVAYNGSKFVAVGGALGTGKVMTSNDGESWTNAKQITNLWLRDIVWDGNRFLAVCGDYTNGKILSSKDGITWDTVFNSSCVLTGIAWNGNTYVAVGFRGSILSSIDGINWVTCNTKTDVTTNLLHVDYCKNMFITVGSKSLSGQDAEGVLLTSSAGYSGNTFITNPKSSTPSSSNIFVTNKVGNSDIVKVTGLSAGDLVKVYDNGVQGNLLGHATVAANKTEVSVYVKLQDNLSGHIYITLTKKSLYESEREEIGYSDTKSSTPGYANITVINNAGVKDSVKVTGLSYGDVLKVYDSEVNGKLLGSASVALHKTEAIASVQFPTSSTGSIYLTIKNKDMSESDRVKVGYIAEPKSDSLNLTNITTINNLGTVDKVIVSGVKTGDVIKVYDSKIDGKLMRSGTVTANKTDISVLCSFPTISTGSIYVTITNKGKTESERVGVEYSAEPKSETIKVNSVTISKINGTTLKVKITDLATGDYIKVFDRETNGKLLCSNRSTNNNTETTFTIKISQIVDGSIYISKTSKGKLESDKLKMVIK